METAFKEWYIAVLTFFVVQVAGLFYLDECSYARSVLKDWNNDTDWYSCHVMCKCNNTMADCSGNYGNLTYVPTLPNNITILIFSRNNLTSIQNDNFFSNVTNITGLDLSHNGLAFVCNGAFKPLTRLTTLILDFNKITNDILHQVLSINTLTNLSLNSSNLDIQAFDVFSQQVLPSLQNINLYNNTLKTVNFTVFAQYKNLSGICLGSCDFCDIIPDQITSLNYLYMFDNRISHFPETCRNGTSLFPNLQVLHLYSNSMHDIPKVCLPNLIHLDLSYNRFISLKSSTFNENTFPCLTYLVIEGTRSNSDSKYVVFQNNSFSSKTLKAISLSNSGILFSKEDIFNPSAFAGCNSLTELRLYGNEFSKVSDAQFSKLFGHLRSLKKLTLSYCQILAITENTFKDLYFLQEIDLRGNSLSSIPNGAFDSIKNLTHLGLDENKIDLIRETTFSLSTRHNLQSLSLANNPFICSCDIKWFRHWFVSNNTLFDKKYPYKCNNLPNTSLAEFKLLDQACILSSDAFTLTVVSVSLVLITFTLTAVFYSLRWHIRLFLYEAFRGRTGYRQQYLMTGNFRYDVFVSYAAEDLYWVREQLMSELEELMGLRLCIHQRDFLPGCHIIDNIVENLKKSKKVLLVFSSHFARSQWCQFELALCLQHVMDHDDILVVVCLEDLPNRILTGSMLAVLKVTTYIQWEDNADARASFWSRLRIALNEVIT